MLTDPNDITQVQMVLRTVGYPLDVNGVWDAATQDAVLAWQSRLQIPQNGEWDTLTHQSTVAALHNTSPGGPVMITPQPTLGMDIERWGLQRAWDTMQSAPGGEYPDESELNGITFLRQTLKALRLESLTDWAAEQLRINRSPEEIMILLTDTPEFRARFPAYHDIQDAGHGMTLAEMIEFEDATREILRSAGLPPSFYDGPEDFAQLMRSNLSVMEIQDRINKGYQQVAEAHSSVRDAFREYFGVEGDAAMAMLYIDPERAQPTLLRMAEEARVSGAARRLDFGISRNLVEEMVRVGITGDQSGELFSQLNQMRGIFDETIGEREDLTVEQGVREQAGLSGGKGREIERRIKQRQARGSGAGGGFDLEAGLQVGQSNE
jgi:peptidoglycan hydrolase-like protein with peptidoglycan-binding domain